MIESPQYRVVADIIDIRADTPSKGEVFAVDTNVWLWMTYTNIQYVNNPPLQYQIKEYPDYLSKIFANEATLYKCELSFAELARIIEAVERDIYEGAKGQIGPKAYRHNYPDLRNDLLEEINGAWLSVNSYASSLPLTVDCAFTNSAVEQLRQKLVDGYDLFILHSMQEAGLDKIITDDGDFATVPGIRVFTANKNVIKAARRQAKLVTR